MSEKTGISMSSVGRIWKSHGLKPHRVSTFKLSNDKAFAEKLEAIVGLYVSPPENAIVFSCDEKSQIQALDRTQPGLPMKKSKAATMTHDYKRNGTTTLFAALNTLTGEVLGTCARRHRHQEWLEFLRKINQSTPKDKDKVTCNRQGSGSSGLRYRVLALSNSPVSAGNPVVTA